MSNQRKERNDMNELMWACIHVHAGMNVRKNQLTQLVPNEKTRKQKVAC